MHLYFLYFQKMRKKEMYTRYASYLLFLLSASFLKESRKQEKLATTTTKSFAILTNYGAP